MRKSVPQLLPFPDNLVYQGFYMSYKTYIRNHKKHWHNFYEIHLITDGNISEEINGLHYDMEPGWIYFLKPYDVHSYSSEKPVSLYKIQFNIDFLDSNIQTALLNSNPVVEKLDDEKYALFLADIKKLYEDYNINDKYSTQAIRHKLNSIVIGLIRNDSQLKQNIKRKDTELIQASLQYIHSNYTHGIKLIDVANYIGLTPNYFCSCFHKQIGQSFKQYLKSLQLNHAANLLRITDMSVNDVCRESGFSALTNFLKDFKTCYGKTPSQYRKEHTK